MTEPGQRERPTARFLRRLAGFVGLRVVFWAGIALLALLLVADVRSLVPGRRAPRQSGETSPAERLPGAGWPHFRGPRYDAVSDETGLPDTWPPQGPPVLWSREIGQGYSGIISVGDRVYTQTQTLYRQAVVCLDAESGETLWEYNYGWPYEAAGMYPGPRATPTWRDDFIYFAGPRGLVGCLDAADGRCVWQVDMLKEFEGRGHDFGYSCSPLVIEDKVIMPVGGRAAGVVALNAADGATVWTSGKRPASYCSALPITLAGHRLVVAFLQNSLALVDLETGRLWWEEIYSQGYNEHAAAPLYDEPYLMIASPFRKGAEVYRLEWATPAGSEVSSQGSVSQGDATPMELNGTTVWFSRQMSNDVASSILVDGYAYGFDLRDIQAKLRRPSRGRFKCLELTTGNVRWETDRTGHASVIAADGKLILLNDTGQVLLLRATPDRYEELARATVFGGECCWTAPALDRGRLYLRSPTKAACLFVGDPGQLDREQSERARPTSELPTSERWDLAWLVGGEREYPFDPPDLREFGRWYAFSLFGVLGSGALVALAVAVPLWWWRVAGAGPWPRIVFWCVAFVLGIVATPISNRLWPHFVLTWPVSLWVAQQAALAGIFRASRHRDRNLPRWVALAGVFLFLATCLGYFHLCRRLDLAMQWVFLIGFLPSWPVAIPAARAMRSGGSLLRDLLWAVLAFSAYFWATAAFIWIRMTGV